ncbi:MAG TPA: carboxyl transferase domain-containing protein, partial [Microbacterium sp.]|uniref:carboxyl transferase domain-containing protein n=1 Tax=Microbacterium sp. TaxID=51671 RepID=UPI002B489768
GSDEAVRTGAGTVGGRDVAVIVSEFGFLGGSIGVATAARIVAAFERAAAERRPVIAGLASGGTRMQEGAAAFLTMRTITAAVQRFRLSGLPYLAHLRHPVTGGVYASWASLADDVCAEPGALIGLLGPRVVEGLAAVGYGAGVPQGVQCAENVHAHGLLDAVLDAAGFRARVATLLDVLGSVQKGAPVPALGSVAVPERTDASDWAAVQAAARPGRPTLQTLISRLDSYVPRRGGDAELVTGWGRLGEQGFLLVGYERSRDAHTTPADIAAARHAYEIAGRLGIPVLQIADTSGAEVSRASEEGGLALEIARTLSAGTVLPVPSATLLLGDGAGAAAIALCGSDLIVAVEDAWLAPLPLAGAAALMHDDPNAQEHMAQQQRVGAASLFADGLIDGIAVDGAAAWAPHVVGHRSERIARCALQLATCCAPALAAC